MTKATQPSLQPIVEEVIGKSVAAVLSAVEIYNKPDFKYRAETFTILMVNAWELLLKAKCLHDADGDFAALVVLDSSGNEKKSRSGNPLTHEINHLAKKAVKDGWGGFSEVTADNVGLLVEIRDSAIHFVNQDLHLASRVQEIGAAALMNYLDLITRWFDWDMRRYHFYLMPLSFYHGFEALQPAALSSYDDSTRNFLKYVKSIEAKHKSGEAGDHQVTVRIETKISRTKGDKAVQWRYTDDPDAPEMRITEEDIRKTHPLTCKELATKLKARYRDFKQDKRYHALKKTLETQLRFCRVRYLDPDKPASGSKKFYNTEIFKEFDTHYTRSNGAKS